MSETNALPFDPAIIRVKIAEMRRQVQGLVALMESYGLKVEPEPIRISRELPRRREPTRGRRRRRATRRASPVKKGPKVADVAVAVLTELHGRAHGKQIVEGLKKRGLLLNVSHPDSSVSTALTRDPRVVRDPNARNTWMLKKEARAAG